MFGKLLPDGSIEYQYGESGEDKIYDERKLQNNMRNREANIFKTYETDDIASPDLLRKGLQQETNFEFSFSCDGLFDGN